MYLLCAPIASFVSLLLLQNFSHYNDQFMALYFFYIDSSAWPVIMSDSPLYPGAQQGVR